MTDAIPEVSEERELPLHDCVFLADDVQEELGKEKAVSERARWMQQGAFN